MQNHEVPAGTVVVGIDGSVASGQALGWAIGQAVLEGRSLTLVHAVGPAAAMWKAPTGADNRPGVEEVETEAQHLIGRARDEVARRAPELVVHELVRVADPRDVLLQVARDAAVLVVGSRGRGPVRTLLLGSVSVAVTRHATCPVVIIRPGNPGMVRHGIAVGADATDTSRSTLEFAYRQASLRDLPLTVMHALWDRIPYPGQPIGPVDPDDVHLQQERAQLAESISGLGEKFPDVQVRTELVRGCPADRLVDAGRRMNMLVLGAHRGGAAAGLVFGSVAASVVEHATCPVAVVPLSEPT